MDEADEFEAVYAVAGPMVRAKCCLMARRLGLRPQDHEDLEQELWLELLAWCRSRHGRTLLRDVPRSGPDPLSQLKQQIHSIAAGLVRSRALRHSTYPARQWLLPPFWCGQLLADPHDEARLRELRLDLSAVLCELPAADRRLCQMLMAGDAAPSLAQTSDLAEIERRIAALRNDFVLMNLHEYL